MEQKPSNQEIDLLELLAKLFTILRNNKALVILCPTLGLIAGLSFFYFSTEKEPPPTSNKKDVMTNMMISTDLLSENEARFLINDLDGALKLPGLTVEQTKKVKLTSDVSKESLSDGRHLIVLKISIITSDESIVSPLQAGLVDYLNKSVPFAKQSANLQKLYTEIIGKIDKELERLEETAFQKGSLIYPRSPIIDWYERKLNYHIALERSKTVQHIDGTQKVYQINEIPHSDKRSLLFYALSGIFLGICVLIFILFIKFFHNYYIKYHIHSSQTEP